MQLPTSQPRRDTRNSLAQQITIAVMNQIRAIQALNKRELENGIPPEASWHADYRDTAYVYFGGLPYELSEGDIIVIFSQYGEPVFIKLARDKETGKSKGFGWLKYRDQRSTDLAVDNLSGANILGRVMRVDHARYKPHEDEDMEEGRVDWESMMRREGKNVEESESESEEEERGGQKRAGGVLEEEKELAKLLREHDEDDPMKAYLIDEKKKEVAEAKERRERKERHRHHRSRRTRRYESEGEDESRRERRERHRMRDSPDEEDPRRRRGVPRSPTGESGGEDRDRYEEERERRRRDKERRRREDDDDDSDRDRRRRRERDDSRDRRRDRDDRDRHRREKRRSRSP
ncbi:hypothetical protein VUR80DRAFT_5331 [Thermomyces stellatus]